METNEQLEAIPINNKDTICVTCLSRDRRLYNVKDFNVKNWFKDLQLSHEDKVCWECKSIMLKFLIFTQKALKAQSLLAQWIKDTKNGPLPVLSNLTTLSLNNLTFTVEYETAIKNDIIIKSEPDDADLNIDTEIPDNDQYLNENLSESIKHEEIEIESKIIVKTDIDNLKETTQMSDESPVKQSQTKVLCAEVYSNPPVLTPLLLKNEASPSQIMNQDALPTRTESTPKVMKTIKLLKIKKLTHEEMMLVGYKMIAEKSKTAQMKSLDTTNKCLQEAGDHVCGVCNERFGEESLLRLHEKKHSTRVFKCSNCSDEFVSEVLAQRHYDRCIMKRHKLYKCNKCVMQFSARNAYRRHKYNAHATDVICDHCGKHFTKKSTLTRHLLIHSCNVPMFECKICNKKYRWRSGLYQHMKTHNYKIDKAAYCTTCDIQFRNMYIYKTHLKNSRNHIKKQDLKYPCPHCENTFNSNSLLKSHIELMHSNELNYHSDECEQSFKTHSSLRDHACRAHEGHVPRKRYTCNVCGRKFTWTNDLKQHMNSHTGKRPFACETCGATFGFSAALYSHKKKHKGCRALREQQKTNCESDVEQTDS